MESSNKIYPRISKYLNPTYIVSGLRNRYRNTEEVYFHLDSHTLKIITIMDEYFYRLMRENYPRYYNSFLDVYLTEIATELETQPLLLLSLPLYNLDINTLRKYLPKIDNIINRIRQKEREANHTFRKLKDPQSVITYSEFEDLLLYFIYSIPNADGKLKMAQEYLAKYLLNPPVNNITHNHYIAVFLIKFFGYKKIREENLTNTKVLIGALPSGTFGISKDDFITINKKLLQNVIIKNNTLDDKFGRETYGYEILGILQILFHELRHQKQHDEAINGKLSDISFFMASRSIIYDMDNNFDYDTNYRCYETEKDANIKAWEEIERLIKTYMPSQNIESVMKNILRYKLTEELEQITGTRRHKNQSEYLSIELLIYYIDKEIAAKPYGILSRYNQFTTFYNKNGSPKRLIELLKIPLVYSYKDFYFGQASYRSRETNYKIRLSDLQFLSELDIKTILNNIKILMNTAQLKMNKINDRITKYRETADDVVGNISNYYEFAKYLSFIANKIVMSYPQSLTILAVKNTIDSINENIDMINKNSLVKKTVNHDKISKVGRR